MSWEKCKSTIDFRVCVELAHIHGVISVCVCLGGAAIITAETDQKVLLSHHIISIPSRDHYIINPNCLINLTVSKGIQGFEMDEDREVVKPKQLATHIIWTVSIVYVLFFLFHAKCSSSFDIYLSILVCYWDVNSCIASFSKGCNPIDSKMKVPGPVFQNI